MSTSATEGELEDPILPATRRPKPRPYVFRIVNRNLTAAGSGRNRIVHNGF